MSENVIQTSFASGELAPSIFARTDLAAYHNGLALCRNFFVDYRSGVSTRQGTKFVLPCKSPGSRLVPFSVSTTVTYAIEFGDHYCRFINNGAPVLEAPFGISNITNGFPAVITAPGHNFVIGDWIFVTGVSGMLAIDNRILVVIAATATTVSVSDVNGNAIDATLYGAYTGGGTASRIYTITSPYAAADLFPNPLTGAPGIKFAQSVSVLYIAHPNYPPTTLSFAAPTNWFFTTLVFATTIATPTNPLIASINIPQPGTATPAVIAGYVYAVTAVDGQGQESLPALSPQVNTTNAAGTGAITATSVTIQFQWTGVAAAASYNIYRTQFTVGNPTPLSIPSNAMLGFLGTAPAGTGTQSFIDTGIQPDFATAPPIFQNNPFAAGNNPGAVSFFQQRVYYAGSSSFPATFWASQPGTFQNFNISNPVQASDTITGTIVSNQLNQIKHMVPMPGGLIFLTGRAAFTLTTGQGANATLAVTPLNATIMSQAYNGSSDVSPLVINEDLIYIQAKGSIVRDLSYNIYAAIYTGTDISVRSNHLFFGHNILQWAYAEEPFKLVWCIRDDGVMLSLTFMKEQQIYGWAHHDTQGLFTSVIAIQEGQVDAPYVVVQRQLPNGTTVSWIVRLMERTLTYGCEDAWAVDAGTRSSLPTPAATITISSSTGTVNVVANAAVFSAGSVGQVLRAGGGIVTITSFTSATQITGTVTQAISQTFPNGQPLPFAAGTWSITPPATKFFGLDYLIGQTVVINADGGVLPPQVVAFDGSITLPVAATKVTAGLAFTCQGQTMPLDIGEPTVQGKRKKIAAVTFKVSSSRGLAVGRSLTTIIPIKEMAASVPLGSPIPLISGDERIVIDPLYDTLGQYYFQVTDPVPSTVLGVVPEIVIGDTK